MKTNYISEEEWILALKSGNLLAFNELFDLNFRLISFNFSNGTTRKKKSKLLKNEKIRYLK